MYHAASRTPIWNSTAFQISNPILMNEDGKRVNVPLATDPISVNALPNCAFLRFDLVIDPSTVHGECRESRFTLKSGVAIPDMVRTNGVSPPITDVRELLNVKDLLVAIQGFTGASPIVGNIKPPERGSTWLECLPEGWTARVHEYYLRCIFAILSRRLQESFVGDVPDTTVQQDLTGCKQTIFDAALRRTVNRTITEYYEAFTSIITGSPYDEDKPFPFDIGELFFAGANPNLIAMVHSDKINVTAATPNERVSAALRRLNTIKDVLIPAEGKVQVIDGQLQAVTGNQRPRTNMALANMVATLLPRPITSRPSILTLASQSITNKPQTQLSSIFIQASRAYLTQPTQQPKTGQQESHHWRTMATERCTWTLLLSSTQRLATTQPPGRKRKLCLMQQFSLVSPNPPSVGQHGHRHQPNAGDVTASRTFMNIDSTCSKTVLTKREKT